MENGKFTKVKGTQITLEKGKEYLVYITKHISTSTPILKMYEDYNPIFIFAGNTVETPKGNFIALDIDQDKIDFGDSMDTEFPKLVVRDKRVINLFKALTQHQKEVWVALWKNHPHFQPLFDNPQIKPLGLSSKLAYLLNNKVFQYKLLKENVPIPKFVVTTKKEALKYFDTVKTKEGVFTSLGYGGQGAGTRIHLDKASLKKYLNEINEDEFLMVNALKLKSTFCIDILITNEKNIFVYGMRTEIKQGLEYVGALYPADIDSKTKTYCYKIANAVGKCIAKLNKGVRGFFNIDFCLTTHNDVYFSEINARYGGGTGVSTLIMDSIRPLNSTKLIDCAIMAMKGKTSKDNNLWKEPENLFTFQKEVRAKFEGITKSIPISRSISELLDKKEGSILVGKLKQNTKVRKGDLLGIIISIQKTKEMLENSMLDVNVMLNEYVKKDENGT